MLNMLATNSCSVACCRLHKETLCTPPPAPVQENAKEPTVEYDFPTEDTVPTQKLKLLGKCFITSCELTLNLYSH